MVGQVAVSPIEGSTTTDYVVHNAVLHCSLSGEGILPSPLPGCECPLDIRSWLTHCSNQLSYRPFDLSFCRHAASPKAPTVGGLKARLVTYHLYAPGARLNPGLPGSKNLASKIVFAGMMPSFSEYRTLSGITVYFNECEL